jgi:hypothetical protein
MTNNFIKLIEEYTIIIPLIQRDYAQGRESETAKANNFLDAINSGLENGLNLDFIYGETREEINGETKNNKFIPLDGQQRLTTLFLLHWYASIGDNYLPNLTKFNYEVRSSTKDFIKELTKEENWAKFDKTDIKKSIKNSSWFFLSWENDPTVVAILNMLNLIENRFKNTKVEEFDKITFELLKLDEFKLTDELYVKMNARGKPLTEFENFKAEFEKYIDDDVTKAKLDNGWLDIFWKIAQDKVDNIKDAPKESDEMFYNFFYNATFNFYLEDNENEELGEVEDFVKNSSIFDFYKNVYDKKKNIEKVISILDNLQNYTSEEFKIFIEKKEISQWERARFYAISLGYIHNLDDKEFSRWRRVSFNLINNQLLPKFGLLKTINSLKNLISDSNKNIYEYIKDDSKKIDYFSGIQKNEESLKATLIEEDINWEKELKQAENNWYLDGQIGFLLDFSENNIDKFKEYRDKFETLWGFAKDNKDNQILIYQALLTKGDYFVEQKGNRSFCSFNGETLRAKVDNWKKVFNGDSREILKDLLDDSAFNIGDIKNSLDEIIDKYSFKCDDPLSFFIKNKTYIEYCGKLQVRFKEDNHKNEILLLTKKQTNGHYGELYSYDLFVNEFEDKTIAPFGKSKYFQACENKENPAVLLYDWELGGYELRIYYKNEKYAIKFYEKNYNLINEFLADTLTKNGFLLKTDSDGEFYLLETQYNCCQNKELLEFLAKFTDELKNVTI